MSFDMTRGGLLVAFAVFGVIVYEIRTVLDFVGIELPLLPYMAAVFVLAGVLLWVITLTGGWRTEPEEDEPA
ncbi:CbaC protein [Halorubrum sp. Ib24]|uniref:CbaC protein n=1 Tax=unclassified Halorubrum TaxID=2642239 RepID=UPI000B998488|nr:MULTISPECIES: CbaC protein [unclassified Halorubrum]OYR38073.1 CbaC protein [Halorubrum sp. Ib24]OYR38782.1 CbaC protein [Halorubrum sp. Eb13]OYR42906.1 CbaC protein [Halorubrum sp. Hd13]OYR49230.1 CbaC protein [Halorubrum sp. Ea1]OYR52435.1 CbaC protein [Halorubrum sp. Ea8]